MREQIMSWAKRFRLAIVIVLLSAAVVGAAYTNITGVAVENSTIDSTVIGGVIPAAGTFSALADTALTAGTCPQIGIGGVFQSSSGPCGILSFYPASDCTWLTQNIVATTQTLLCSETVTAPAVGCPCKMAASYGIFWDSSIALDVEAWVQTSDTNNGTVTFDDSTQGTAGSEGAYMTTGATRYSAVKYADSVSIAVHLYYEASAAANSPVGIHQTGRYAPDNVGLQLAFVPSS